MKEQDFKSSGERDSCYLTRPDDDDGDTYPIYREYTHPREFAESRCFATNNANTIIGPILNIRVLKIFGIHGIEVRYRSNQ